VLRHTVSTAAAATAAAATAAPSPAGAPPAPATPATPATRPLGLNLLESIDDIRHPVERVLAHDDAPTRSLTPIRLDAPLRAVLFDMDGTLTDDL
jgi:hypothetical protein